MNKMHMSIFSIICIFLIETTAQNFNCSDVQQLFIGNIFTLFASSNVEKEQETALLLTTKINKEPTDMTSKTWQELETLGLNAAKKTYIIVHGFQSSPTMKWVNDSIKEILNVASWCLKNNGILKNFSGKNDRRLYFANMLCSIEDVNIILVDWRGDSNRWNYVDVVQLTPIVSQDVIKYLARLEDQFKKFGKNSKTAIWNQLYFIGHSLGAHICGQIGYRLRRNKFFKVMRITGLDPAQPCFTKCASHLRLDKQDAAYVDIIHTQTGNNDNKTDSFGLKSPAGHADFYVSGGVMQPECEKSNYVELSKMICSHKIVCEYFIESVMNSKNGKSKFVGHRWDQTYETALQIFNHSFEENKCTDCVEMGFNAIKHRQSGIFIVIVSSKSPYSKFDNETNVKEIKKTIERLNEPTLPEPSDALEDPEDTIDFWA